MIRNILIFSSIVCVLMYPTGHVGAQTVSDLQAKIDQRAKDIDSLHKEIDSINKEIDSLSSQATSLANTLKSLDLTRKKLETNISLTEDKIASKNLQIRQLASQISDKEGDISDDKRIIRQTFRSLNETGDESLPEIILSKKSLAEIMDSANQLGILQDNLYSHIQDLGAAKASLEDNKKATEKAKSDLVALTAQLKDQRSIILSTSAEKTALLKQTNQSESSYKALLATRRAQEAAFQQEMFEYESQLHLLVSASSIPHAGSGVLSWPLDTVFITQYFGNTPFATANPQIYKNGHPGVDMRASIGTPVKAAMSGIVTAVYGGEKYSACSYGKWVMIKHSNGLSTLYGHLSLPKVSIGQQVSTGELLGYSGNTGISTGPHLHFGVYATQGIVVTTSIGSSYCKGASTPLADPTAKLNPLSYL